MNYSSSLCNFLLLVASLAADVPTLGSYNVDKNKLSISGFSSGGFFTAQFHVAFSKIIMGAGIIAGATPVTMTNAYTYAREGKIDDLSNLKHSKVYLFSGIIDTVVYQEAVKVLEKFYDIFIDKNNIETEYNIPAEHSIVTDDFGNYCGILLSPYINNCGYCTAYHILQHIYGDIKPANKNNVVESNLMEFSQTEFFSLYSSMDNIGYIYVPTACHNNGTMCRLHIAFHGCEMGREWIGNAFALHAEYNGIAEVNNIIIIYPQVHTTLVINPYCCWDWWGYTGPDFAVKDGLQMAGVRKILGRVARV